MTCPKCWQIQYHHTTFTGKDEKISAAGVPNLQIWFLGKKWKMSATYFCHLYFITDCVSLFYSSDLQRHIGGWMNVINGSDTENCWTSQSPTPQKCKLLNHGFISTFLGLTQAHTIPLHVHKNIKQGTVYRRKYLISDSLEQSKIFNAPKKKSVNSWDFSEHIAMS